MKKNIINVLIGALCLLPGIAHAGPQDSGVAAPATLLKKTPVIQNRVKAMPRPPANAELPTPVILKFTPAEVTSKVAVVTVQGQYFGANQSGGRKVILTQKDGGMQVIPPVDDWKSNRITFKAPDLSGLYIIQVDNGSAKPLSNGVEIMLGVKQKDISIDFDPVFGGTRLDADSCCYFYLGPKGGSPSLRWRTIHATELSGFPRLLYYGEYLKVVSKGWNQKKNTMYDISIKCLLRFDSTPPRITFDSANHMIFSVPYTADIYHTAKIFWYNTQDEDPHGVKDNLLTKPMQGILTIRVPLTVENVARTRKILSSRAETTFTGDFVIKELWPLPSLPNRLQNDWAAAKEILATAIADKFASSDYRMSIFGEEFTKQVLSQVGPGSTILRFQTTGSHTMRVFYLD
jgi:hypothetical protein